jgi:hypothetical protein
MVPSDDDGVGVAMNVAVVRDGVVRSHLVLHAGLGFALLSENEEAVRVAMLTIAHEAAHVYDQAVRERLIPGIAIGALSMRAEEWWLFGSASACWDEYAACRLSAPIAPSHVRHFETVFCDCLANTPERCRGSVEEFREHRDAAKTLCEVCGYAGNLLRYYSYLLGHVAGASLQLREAAPRAVAMLQEHRVLTPVLAELQEALERLWEERDAWKGIAAYDPLRRVVRKMLQAGGISLSTTAEGLRVGVGPCTL